MRYHDDTKYPAEEWEGRTYHRLPAGDYFSRVDVQGKPRRAYYVKTSCRVCGVDVFQARSNSRRRPGARPICRSLECFSKIRSGENSPLWKGPSRRKRGASGGHVMTYAPEHPAAYKNWVPEHRLVAERTLGRLLRPEEIVHHIDMDMANNEPGNLVVFSSTSDHHLAHGSLNRCVKELVARGVLRFGGDGEYYVEEA